MPMNRAGYSNNGCTARTYARSSAPGGSLNRPDEVDNSVSAGVTHGM